MAEILLPSASAGGVVPLGDRPWRAWGARQAAACRRLAAEADAPPRPEEREAAVEADFSRYRARDYLFSWTTAVAGVEVESDVHTIVAPHGKWVNDNGNAWQNRVLLEKYLSFILAENYIEHVQRPELSVGKVLDTVAWVRREKHRGRELPTIFVDCLIATSKRKYPSLCEDVRAKRFNAVSMGCVISHFQCSRCGRVFREGEDEACAHVSRLLGRKYRVGGETRVVAEMCGVPGKPGSCRFIELSFVRVQAFGPALVHGHLKRVERGYPLKAFVPESRAEEMFAGT